MKPRHVAPAFLLASSLLLPGPAGADKLEKQDRIWLEDEVAAIIVPNEVKIFRDLKKDDRPEFVKIFWARRDPNPETAKPENEFKASYLKLKAEADKRYRIPGRSGAATDCGRVFILLGEPDSVRTEQRDAAVTPGARSPEGWIYKDKPSRLMRVAGGEMQLVFDDTCQLPVMSRFSEQLVRVAEAKITRPNVDYRFGKDGRLVKLVDLLPKPSPAQTLLKEPRQDFPVETQSLFLKTQDSGTALVGLVRGSAEGLTVQELAGRKAVKLIVAASATGDDGRPSAFYEQPTTADVAADGHFVASFRLGLKPGKYTIQAGALDDASKKGSLASSALEVPDLNAGELSAASLIVLSEIQENVTNDPAHPYAAFLLGGSRIVPRFGATFTKDESLSFFYQYYDAKLKSAGMSMEQYNQLQPGMTLEQVRQILGADGVEKARSANSVSITWMNPNGGLLSATFVAGKLEVKAQEGLEGGAGPGKASVIASLAILKEPAAVTMNKFQRLEVGMPLERVRAIAGPGEEQARNAGAVIYSWKNPDGSNMTATFVGGVLDTKAQSGLKSGVSTPVARAADQPFDIPIGGTVIGPVSLAKYEPGSYLVQLKIKDNVGNKEITRELPFEIK